MRYFIWVFIFLMMNLPLQAGIGSELRKASKLYANEQYGQALSSYEQALKQDPQNAKAAFGAGAAAYRLKDYTQAQKSFEDVTQQEGPLGQDALFNLGNTFYRAGQQDPAITAYRQAILQNPQDKEAIHNLQLVLQQKQNQQNQNNQNNQNQNNDSQNQDQQEQQNQGQAPQQQDQNQQPQQPQNQQNQLDKQAADRVMQLARDNEYKRPTQPGNHGDDETVEKDW